jgi:glycosyltransferase involved in cell wall biosynthesis
MKISVLISNYNYRQFVGEAIESVLAQTYPACDVIVVDDGSTDGSVEHLQAVFGDESRVRIVSTENRGQIAAMCKGREFASGDIISFLDADDTWAPTYLQRVRDAFARIESVDFVMVNVKPFGPQAADVWNESTSDIDFGITSGLIALSETPPWQGMPTSGLSLKRALLDRVLPPETLWSDWKISADDCLVYGGALLGAHKYCIAEALVNYRLHGKNSWASREWSAVLAARNEISRARMLHYYRQRAFGSQRPVAGILHFEFKSLPRPSFARLRLYVALVFKARSRWMTRARVALMMAKYWWQQRHRDKTPECTSSTDARSRKR